MRVSEDTEQRRLESISRKARWKRVWRRVIRQIFKSDNEQRYDGKGGEYAVISRENAVTVFYRE